MFTSFGFHGIIKKYKLFLAVHGDRPFPSRKISTRAARSLQKVNPGKRASQTHRKLRQLDKPTVENGRRDSKLYMRDTVGNISKILRFSTWDSAKEQLQMLSIKWDSYTINQVLKTHPPMEKAWLFFNWASQLKGFKHDQFTYTTMMDIFGEAGRISSLNLVFEQMVGKGIKIDVVTYTSRLHWLSSAGDIDGSVKAWKEMKDSGFNPTVVSYTAYMKVLFDNKRVKEAADVYREMLECGHSPNCYTYTVLMDHLAGSGNYKAVIEVFNKMQEAGVLPDKAACNILIQKCCEFREIQAMIQILQYMKDHSIVLRYPIYSQALDTFRIVGENDLLLRQVNPHLCSEWSRKEEIIKFGAATSYPGGNLDRQLVKDLLVKQKFVTVDNLISEAWSKNIQMDPAALCNIILLNCAHCRVQGALLSYEYSVKLGITISRAEFLGLIGLFIRGNMFPNIVGIVQDMVGLGHTLGIYLGTILIYKLGCARKPVSAAKIFKLLPDQQKCAATYTALIHAYFLVGSVDKGLKIFETMQAKGICPALGTYNVLLSGLEIGGRVTEAEIVRKGKKSLQSSFRPQDVTEEERICNLLFAGNGVF